MKKFLLSIFCLIGLATAYADVTETFTYDSENGWLPDVSTTSAASNYAITATSLNTGINYSLVASYCNNGYSYLMLGSKNLKTEASISFALPENCTGFSIVTGSNASASAVYTLTVGNTVIDSGTKWGKGATKVFEIPTEAQVAGDIVKIASTSTSYNGQIASITFAISSSVASPEFSVAEGVYTEPFNLTLSAETGNSIYYTLDGSTPTVDSNLYEEAIEISEYTVVKAVAIDANGVNSSIATATYAFQNTQNTAMTVSEAIAWIEAGKDATTEQYVAGYITEITEVSMDYGNATYSIADAPSSTDVLLVFRGKSLNGEKFIAEDEIEVGDKVLIYGKLKDYNGTPEVDTNNYIVSILEEAATGVEETLVDENAPVEYYNLQGMKVANPENGLFIKKQGNKATKVVL